MFSLPSCIYYFFCTLCIRNLYRMYTACGFLMISLILVVGVTYYIIYLFNYTGRGVVIFYFNDILYVMY